MNRKTVVFHLFRYTNINTIITNRVHSSLSQSPPSSRLICNLGSVAPLSLSNSRYLHTKSMPRSTLSGSISSPKVDFGIDMGNSFLNYTVDGFLKIGAVGAGKVAAEETFECLKRGSISKGKAEHALKKMLKEGAYWGAVGGLYVGAEYGMERIRGTRDWKNAMLGGALTGALISAASNHGNDKVVKDAITGAAVATAAEFINYLT